MGHDNWAEARLGPLTMKVGSGITPRGGQSVYVVRGVPFLRSQNVRRGALDLSDVAHITREQHAAMSSTHVQPGDVLLNISGASIGRSCVVPDSFSEGNVNQHVCIIRCNGELNPRYLCEYLNSWHGQRLIWRSQAGGNREGLNYDQIRKFRIPLPPRHEQDELVAMFSTWELAIHQTEKLIAARRRLKQGLMQQLLTGQRRFPKFANRRRFKDTKYGPIPADWEIVHFDDVATINQRTLPETTDPEHSFHYVDLSAVKDGSIRRPSSRIRFADAPSRARRLAAQGDIVMATVRPNLRGFALPTFDTSGFVFSTGFAIISPKRADDSEFLYHSLYSDVVARQLHGLIAGSSYPAITGKDAGRLRLCFPSNPRERAQIGRVLTVLSQEINLLRKYVRKLSKQKRGLMQKLLTKQARTK